MNRSKWLWAGVVLFALASCGKNTAPMDRSNPPAVPPGGAAGQPMASPHGGAWAGGTGAMPVNTWTISGKVELAPQFAGKVGASDVLYVIARKPGERQPLAVERYEAPAFPLDYTLHTGHGGGGPEPPAGMEVVAKLSRSGLAGPPQPGDLEGSHDGVAAAGATDVNITLNVEH
ncbi:MAG: hypothetical protein HY907_12055 [Deltaproteobacteria bacterium]|nr:hypothetical protein [Deltaproteobacteria bacterium]